MDISFIVAVAENGVIANHGSLPWHLETDGQRYLALTDGHPVIMGRKTYQAIGEPMPNRKNIVITRDEDFSAPGITVVHTVEDAITAAGDDKEIFIIGGAEIFKLAEPMATKFYLTRVHSSPEGDTFYNPDMSIWQEIKNERHAADEHNDVDYSFIDYVKKAR